MIAGSILSITAISYFFLVAGWLGLSLSYYFKLRLGWLERLTGSWLVGTAILTELIFWQSWLIPFEGKYVLMSLSLVVLMCAWGWQKHGWGRKWEKEMRQGWKKEMNWRLGGFLGVWGAGLGLIWRRMLVREAGGLYAGWVNVWGDWGAHLAYTTSFAWGDNFPVEMPILAGEKFSYPFLADFLSAVLMKLGAGLIPSMLVPGWILSMGLVMMLLIWGKSLWGSLKAGMVTVWLFLLNGGLGFWWWWKDLKSLGIKEMLVNLPREYTHLDKIANIQWINMISSQVIPQRGFLLGFPLAIAIYWLLWQEQKRKGGKWLKTAGWITAGLPLIQAHSFVMVTGVAGWMTLKEMMKVKKKKELMKVGRRWLGYWLPVVVLGVGQIGYFYGSSLSQEGFIKFRWGWMADKDGSPVWWFWLKNLGLTAGLIGGGMMVAKKKLREFSWPFWCLFVLANLWIWQPWEWDNTKMLSHWFLMASALGAGVIVKGVEKKGWGGKTAAMLALLISVWAGGLDVWRLGQYEKRKLEFFNNQQLELAEWVRKNTDKKAVFLTADNHDHWVPTLTGRKVVLGFKGWLWTYGIDYGEQEETVRKIFRGEEGAEEVIKEKGIDYAVVGPRERAMQIGIKESWLRERFPMVFSLGEERIYKLSD